MRKIFFLLGLFIVALPAWADDNQDVILNTQSFIYHSPDCKLAQRCTGKRCVKTATAPVLSTKLLSHRCTRNCIKTTLDKAVEYGARPCKVCGGTSD